MANTNTTKKTGAKKASTTKKTSTATKPTTAKSASAQDGPTYEELLSLVQQLGAEVNSLKAELTSNGVEPVELESKTDSKADKLLDMLANKKSDREITLIHNCEMIGGLSTHLDLSGMVIDFRTLGEQRVLSWQQFEECVSKYRSFFDKQIILLANEHKDLAERYGLPCVDRGEHILTRSELATLYKLNVKELEDFVKSLSDEDKDFLYSFWLGKVYEKVPGFYDRVKIEALNHLSGRHMFDNILTLMNGDYIREEESDSKK